MTERNLEVWIELPKPEDDEHAKDLCEHANRMLNRLSEADEPKARGFFWSAYEKRYCYASTSGSYRTLSDNGEWFNLRYLGRAEEGETK